MVPDVSAWVSGRRRAPGTLVPKRSHCPGRERVIHLSWPLPASSTCSTSSPRWPGPKTAFTPSVIAAAAMRPSVRTRRCSALVPVRQVWAVRCPALRDAPAPGEGRGRRLLHPIGPHRPVQPRAGADLLQHRLPPARAAQPGLVGGVRPRVGVPEPPGLRGDVDGIRDQRRRGPVVERLHAHGLQRRALPELGGPDPGRRVLRAGRSCSALARPQRRTAGSRRRGPGDHGVAHDGLPPADLGRRADELMAKRRRRSTCTAPTRPSRHSREPVCWHGG
jgi:hypothetical protein